MEDLKFVQFYIKLSIKRSYIHIIDVLRIITTRETTYRTFLYNLFLQHYGCNHKMFYYKFIHKQMLKQNHVYIDL